MTRELTGRHVLIIAIAAFGIIITANLSMLFAATGSFPGLVVKNSYVAGQGWDARAAAQRNLGWQADVRYRPGTLTIRLTDAAGNPVADAAPQITIGRPATDAEDMRPMAAYTDGAYRIPVDLAPGLWRVELTTTGPKPYVIVTEISTKGDN